MAASVATVAVIRMYLRVMNDDWVRGVGSDTDMGGNEEPFPSLATESDDDTDSRHSVTQSESIQARVQRCNEPAAAVLQASSFACCFVALFWLLPNIDG